MNNYIYVIHTCEYFYYFIKLQKNNEQKLGKLVLKQ